MSVQIPVLLAGLGGFTYGERIVSREASATAHKLGVAPLVVGLVVCFGTSAPADAGFRNGGPAGNSGISIGNTVGSNIANIALILGLSALVGPASSHGQASQSLQCRCRRR